MHGIFLAAAGRRHKKWPLPPTNKFPLSASEPFVIPSAAEEWARVDLLFSVSPYKLGKIWTKWFKSKAVIFWFLAVLSPSAASWCRCICCTIWRIVTVLFYRLGPSREHVCTCKSSNNKWWTPEINLAFPSFPLWRAGSINTQQHAKLRRRPEFPLRNSALKNNAIIQKRP